MSAELLKHGLGVVYRQVRWFEVSVSAEATWGRSGHTTNGTAVAVVCFVALEKLVRETAMSLRQWFEHGFFSPRLVSSLYGCQRVGDESIYKRHVMPTYHTSTVARKCESRPYAFIFLPAYFLCTSINDTTTQ